ncbi:G protein-coupled receptor [Dirofilaria immitis]|nr:G protein-coupled receptor [Dirofilaria immitis]
MSSNRSNICLTNQQMRLHGNELEKYLQRFLYPCIVILGIAGNVLNLTVLLNRSMRSRLVVAVCADRLIGIRKPLYTKTDWNKYRTLLLITVIVTITGIVNFYQHFQYKCFMRNYCHQTQIYSRCILINNDGRWFWNRTNPYSETYRNFIDISVTFTKEKRSLRYLKMEHRVTLMVALIVTTFIILNGPSAVIHLVNLAYKKKLNYNFTLLGNTLVIIDKACNFILFCLTSRHFRARLFELTQRKVNRFSANLLQFSDKIR